LETILDMSTMLADATEDQGADLRSDFRIRLERNKEVDERKEGNRDQDHHYKRDRKRKGVVDMHLWGNLAVALKEVERLHKCPAMLNRKEEEDEDGVGMSTSKMMVVVPAEVHIPWQQPNVHVPNQSSEEDNRCYLLVEAPTTSISLAAASMLTAHCLRDY